MTTLLDYFARRAPSTSDHPGDGDAPQAAPTLSADAATSSDVEYEEPSTTGSGWRRPRDDHSSLARHALDQQLRGSLHPWAAAQLQHQYWSLHSEAAVVDVRPNSAHDILGGTGTHMPELGLQCAEFDSQGELLVTGSWSSLLLVHSAALLQHAAEAARRVPPIARNAMQQVQPLLAVRTQLPRLQTVRWSPANENLVGAASGGARMVHLYDLQHTRGQPSRTFDTSLQRNGPQFGANDLAFFSPSSASAAGGGGYAALAGNRNGQMLVWDGRAGASACMLSARLESSIVAVALVEGDSLALAGTSSGEVRLWDLRGGSGGPLSFGGTGVAAHPLLGCISLQAALDQVPGLVAQAGGTPAAGLLSMQLDPCDPSRLAFHLKCGWSGVLDLVSRRVTHVHAPPLQEGNSLEDEAGGLPGLGAIMRAIVGSKCPVKATWTRDGRRYVVPCSSHPALQLLDFSAGSHAGCFALGPDAWEGEGQGGGEEAEKEDARKDEEQEEQAAGVGGDPLAARRVPPVVTVALGQGALCTAALPGSNMLFAGGANNRASLVTPVYLIDR